MYVKLNGTLNTTLNNHWVSGTNNKTIDDDYYIIAHSPSEGSNMDLDYMVLSQTFGTTGVSTFQSAGELQLQHQVQLDLFYLEKKNKHKH